MACSLGTINLSMLMILAFVFSGAISAMIDEGQFQPKNDVSNCLSIETSICILADLIYIMCVLKVGNRNVLDVHEARLMEGESADVRGKEDCFWSGTAPFCQGRCPSKVYVTKASDSCGDGKCCLTGTKKFCCPK